MGLIVSRLEGRRMEDEPKHEETDPKETTELSKEQEHHEHHIKKPHFKRINLASTDIMIVLSIILVIVCGINVYLSGTFNPAGDNQVPQTPPAELQLTAITTNCPLCFNISAFLSGIKQLDGVKVTAEKTIDLASSEAQALVSKYGITKVPTVIITGGINDSRLLSIWSQIGKIKEGAVILTEAPPPYFDIAASKVIGIVNFTAISDSTCANCSKADEND